MSDVSVIPNSGDGDPGYEDLLYRIQQRFLVNTRDGNPLFVTDATDLFALYLSGFPAGEKRQHVNCSACRQFINRFGGLAVVSAGGTLIPAFWKDLDVPKYYQNGIHKLARAVAQAKIVSPFYSTEEEWGTPVTGKWTHFSVTPSPEIRFSHATLSANQMMAAKREDYHNVLLALSTFTPSHVDQVVNLLSIGGFYRAEKVLPNAIWLRDTWIKMRGANPYSGKNVLWREVVKAPAGFCHIRSGMLGALLEDVQAGLPFEVVKRKFEEKMDPLRYQRPTAAPAAGTIDQAEKLFAKLNLERALPRRIAFLSEVPLQWKPKDSTTSEVGLFSHLKKEAQVNKDKLVFHRKEPMSWTQFAKVILPTVDSMEMALSIITRHFVIITTAVNPDAPPILQWDSPDKRNPFAWYCWATGAPPEQFGLPLEWVPVAGITRLPARWGDDGGKFAHQGDGSILLLKGAKETRIPGLCLFPEILRSELHGVRSVIEAQSQHQQMQGLDGDAIGYGIRSGKKNAEISLRARVGDTAYLITIDRWE